MKILHERGPEVFRSGYLRFLQETITLPSGEKIERDVLDHPGAVVVIPILRDTTMMLVDQYRYPMREQVLEFPAGTLEADEPLENCVRRELQEEIGFDSTAIKKIGTLYPTPGFCNEVQHIFIAKELFSSSLAGDEDEIIQPLEISVSDFEQAITAGKIRDAKTIAAFFQARLLGEV